MTPTGLAQAELLDRGTAVRLRRRGGSHPGVSGGEKGCLSSSLPDKSEHRTAGGYMEPQGRQASEPAGTQLSPKLVAMGTALFALRSIVIPALLFIGVVTFDPKYGGRGDHLL